MCLSLVLKLKSMFSINHMTMSTISLNRIYSEKYHFQYLTNKYYVFFKFKNISM